MVWINVSLPNTVGNLRVNPEMTRVRGYHPPSGVLQAAPPLSSFTTTITIPLVQSTPSGSPANTRLFPGYALTRDISHGASDDSGISPARTE